MEGRTDVGICALTALLRSPTEGSHARQRKIWFMTKDDMIKIMENAKTISGFILTPSVSSLKNVSRPALDAGIGALFFLLLIVVAFCDMVLKRNVGQMVSTIFYG
jgi:hypothetical protein